MGVLLLLGAALALDGPFYTEASLANSASNTNGPFAPNAFLTIYGTGLANSTPSWLAPISSV